MPVVSCPKCPTKLSVPEGATGNVKCPKCSTVFPVIAPKPSAAFEVVEDDEPAASPPPPKSAARPKAAAPVPLPPPPPANNPFTLDDDEPKKKKPARDEDDDDDRPRSKRRRDEDEDDDDEDEHPRKKKRRDDDDDEDDRPRSKRRRDEDDDDDDRPRSKRRRNDDDDDDEDDRPRKKKHREDDDEDDEDDWHRAPKKKKKGAPGFASAKTGVLLLNISLWLYAASLALISFFIFLGMVGAFDATSSTTTTTRRTSNSRGGFSQNDDFSTTSSSKSTAELVAKLPGILGIGNWVVAGIGFGFCIAGPKQARGMAITAASLAGVAGVHLVLAGISINNVGGMMGGYGGGASSGTWILLATTLPILDTFLPVLFYGGASHIGSDYIFALLGAGCECARLIFAMLMVKSLAIAAKDYEAEEKAQLGVMSAGGVTGATVIVAAGLSLLPKMVTITSFNFYFGSILLVYLAFTGMMAMPILATNITRKALGGKGR